MKKISRVIIIMYCMLLCAGCNLTEEVMSEQAQGQQGVENASNETASDVSGTASESSDEGETERAALLEQCLSYVDSYYFQERIGAQLFTLQESQKDAENFEGTWNRTNVANSYEASFTIAKQDADGFDFEGSMFYYSHSGYVEGRAFFIEEDIALYRYSNEFYVEGVNEEWEYILFVLKDGMMQVSASGSGAEFGLGANCSVTGEYTTKEPVYTNATVLEDTFTEEERAILEKVLGKDVYKENFLFVVQNGVVLAEECVTADGKTAMEYECFMPTMGGYEMNILIVSTGECYCEVSGKWYTNVLGAQYFPPVAGEGERDFVLGDEGWTTAEGDKVTEIAANSNFEFLLGSEYAYYYYVNGYRIDCLDGKSYIVLSFDYASDDYFTEVYMLDNGKYVKCCEVSGAYVTGNVVEMDGIEMSMTFYLLGTYASIMNYALDENGILTPVEEVFSFGEEYWEYRGLTLAAALPVWIDGERSELSAGTVIIITGTNDSGEAYFTVKDTGVKGTIQYSRGESGEIIIEGKNEYEYFVGLPYAG